MSLKPFNFGIVTRRVMPAKAIRNSYAPQLDLGKIIDLAIWGAKENLLEEISFCDDDIMRWNPDAADDYKDKNSKLYTRLAEIKAKLDAAGLPVHSITCDLVGNSAFAHGAFTNNDPKVRELARRKAERALEIGKVLNASLFVYESDSDGFDSPFTVCWADAWKRLAAGLDTVSQYANTQKMTNYRGGCIAPRQSAAYMYGYINTPADALNIIQSLLHDRNFWGITPATSQLADQGWEKAPASLANIVGARRLASLKIGGGADKAFRRAPHPIMGTANLTETVQSLWLLDKLGWKGTVEYDNTASISDAKCNNDELTCKQFIANCANALTVALQTAEKIKSDALSSLTPAEADLMAATAIASLDVDNVILRTIKNLPPAFETPQKTAQSAGNQNQQNNNANQNQQRQNQNQQRQNQNQNQQRQNQNPQRQNQNPQRQNPKQQRQNQQNTASEAPAVDAAPTQVPAPAPAPAPASEEELHVESTPTSFLHIAPKTQEKEAAAATDVKEQTADIAELPKPAETSELPKPAETAELPKPTETDELPKQAETAEQPKPAEAAEQPKPAEAVEQPKPAEAVTKPVKKESRAKSRKAALSEPLPPPMPLTEDVTESAAEDELPIILPDEKPVKTKARTQTRSKAAPRKTSGSAKRTTRKKPSDSPAKK